jgi:hypothetical protein
MKTPIAFTLIVLGASLIVAPVLMSQRQLERVASHYQEHGDGSQLPNELRPRQYGAYDWACMAAGAILSFIGTRGSVRTTASGSATVPGNLPTDSLAKV